MLCFFVKYKPGTYYTHCHEWLDHLKISSFTVCVCVWCVRVACMFPGSSSPHGDMFLKRAVQLRPTSFLPDDGIHWFFLATETPTYLAQRCTQFDPSFELRLLREFAPWPGITEPSFCREGRDVPQWSMPWAAWWLASPARCCTLGAASRWNGWVKPWHLSPTRVASTFHLFLLCVPPAVRK